VVSSILVQRLIVPGSHQSGGCIGREYTNIVWELIATNHHDKFNLHVFSVRELYIQRRLSLIFDHSSFQIRRQSELQRDGQYQDIRPWAYKANFLSGSGVMECGESVEDPTNTMAR
jgi:hypothetical protein